MGGFAKLMLELQSPQLENRSTPTRSGFIFFLGCLGLAVYYLYHQAGIAMYAIPEAGHDDLLYVNLARFLSVGNWFGPYDNLTLAKSPGYAFWLALCHSLGAPLLFMHKLLYLFACGLLIRLLRSCRVPALLCLVLFAALLFNPAMTSMHMLRVYRSSVHPALTLLLIALLIRHFLLEPPERRSAFLAWSFFSAAGLAFYWLNREEGICALPVLAVLALGRLLSLQGQAGIRKMVFCLLPIVLSAGLVSGVAGLNYAKFGVFTCSEIKSSAFQGSLLALQRIQTEKLPYVTVSRQACVLACAASPAFKRLNPHLEELWPHWAACAPENLNQPEGEIAGGWFPWALRDAAQAAGYHATAATAEDYYTQLALELNQALEDGRLPRDPSPYFFGFCLSGERLKQTARAIPQALWRTVRFSGCDAARRPSRGPEAGIRSFERFTHSPMARGEDPQGNLEQRHAIWLVFRLAMPWIAGAGLLSFLVSVYLAISRRRLPPLFLICAGLLGMALALLFCLCLIHLSAFQVLDPLYLSSVYPLVILFSILSLGLPWVFVGLKAPESHS